MEKMKEILLDLKTEISARNVSLNTKDGLKVLRVPEEPESKSSAALDAAILGCSEMRIVAASAIVEGQHEKIYIVRAGSLFFISAEFISEKEVSEDIKQRIKMTARLISSFAK